MSQLASGSVVCEQCSRAYRWKAELAGRRVKCKCGGRITFPVAPPAGDLPAGEMAPPRPQPAAPRRPAPVPQPRQTAAIEELGEADVVGETPPSDYETVIAGPPPVVAAVCRGCSRPLPAGAVLCTHCGTDQRTGRTMRTKIKGPGPDAGEVAIAAGKVVLAMIVGGITALVGAGVWLGVMIATDKEIGIVAWLIGLGIGGVMRLINPGGSTASGIMAALFALVAIALPKAAILLLLMAAHESAAGLFSPFDILWFFLAVSSAYKLARGSS